MVDGGEHGGGAAGVRAGSRARLGDKEEWRWAVGGCVVQKRVAVYDIPGRCAHVNDCLAGEVASVV